MAVTDAAWFFVACATVVGVLIWRFGDPNDS